MIQKKILIAGGHLSPAIAVIEELHKNNETCKISYVGRIHPLEGDSSLSLEYKTIKELNIPFYSIITGRFERHFGLSFFTSLLKIPIGLIQAFYYFFKVHPDGVITFGGYVSFPIGIVSYLLNIPFIIHEQTESLGLSNRILSRIADMTFLTFDDTKYVPGRIKTEVIGMLKRTYDERKANKEIIQFGDVSLPLIFICGGSLGSRSINNLIYKSLSKLLVKYRVIHQCGEAGERKDYSVLKEEQKKLHGKIADNYNVFPSCDYHTFYFILKSSDLVIGRSGANTVSDLSTLRKKSIFIPLPWSGDNEQLLNAKRFINKYSGYILEQKDAESAKLITAIEDVLNLPEIKSVKEEKSEEKVNSAASRIVRVVNSL